MAKRGSYAKGVAKREEILTRALEVVAEQGFRSASVREIADAVGLSQAGLLHYFGTKEQLFVEILRKRDEVDLVRFTHDPDSPAFIREDYAAVIEHNSEVPGLVELFSRMSVEAADPEHPAHDYFVARGEAVRTTFAEALRHRQEAGELTDAIDAETLARIFQAVSDGLQVQWLLDRDVDMPGAVGALFDALASPPPPRRP
ncbi:TetR family transcriptional regulator [Microbacterium mangrovi]|uniref:TetR family transcriptional regulator n=1 Tax=Microbacterium mangrovi TaxID=1348253 RepID=A0A0B2A1H6_9MICO|nr:TetR/AcrR family transcriptional regulator [Microbacterium mangrovi]KHK95659.1 TetR family transcriptional regulator [Microbacterium mangrovi]